MLSDVVSLSRMEVMLTVDEIQQLFNKGDLTKDKLEEMYKHTQYALLSYKQAIEGELSE